MHTFVWVNGIVLASSLPVPVEPLLTLRLQDRLLEQPHLGPALLHGREDGLPRPEGVQLAEGPQGAHCDRLGLGLLEPLHQADALGPRRLDPGSEEPPLLPHFAL